MASRSGAPAGRAAPPPPVRRLEPRRYATDPYQRAPTSYPEQRRRRRGGRLILTGLLIGLLFAAAVVTALVISTSTSPTLSHIRTTVNHDANSAINALSNLVSQYTR
jgi:hypothetical protein